MVRSWLVAACSALMTGPCLADDVCGSPALPCTVPEGAYFAAAPTWHAGDPPRPAVVFLHGAGGSGGVSRSRTPTLRPTDHGPGAMCCWRRPDQATPRPGRFVLVTGLTAAGAGRGHLPRPTCWTDAAAALSPGSHRVFVTGFSMGAGPGVAACCHEPGSLRRLRPVDRRLLGAASPPAAPARSLLLTHGWRDDAVPLEGWEEDQAVEGGIFDGVQLWRRVNGCPDPHAGSFAAVAQFWQRAWTGCAPGSPSPSCSIRAATRYRRGGRTLALDWFEAVVPASH